MGLRALEQADMMGATVRERTLAAASSVDIVPASGVRAVATDRASRPTPITHRGAQRYQPIRPLGAGGMGEVDLAFDKDIGRMVAVKRLLPGVDDATAMRFEEEVRTLGRIEHANIVPIYDVGVDDDGRFFFVMKYVEGETLADVIQRLRDKDPAALREYTVERRIGIFLDVLRALGAAHAAGVLHRDVKPSNVMVGKRGEVMVLDWGIAKRTLPHGQSPDRATQESGESAAAGPLHTRSGAIVGTPPYMSPEQALGKNDELDGRSDLYSAVAVLHELLTLEHYLGPRGSANEVLIAIITEDVSFSDLAERSCHAKSALPAELLRVLAKGLEKDPADRFQSADDMIEMLEAALRARVAISTSFAAGRRWLRAQLMLAGARVRLVLALVVVVFGRLRPA